MFAKRSNIFCTFVDIPKYLYEYILTNAGFDIFMAIDTTQSFAKVYGDVCVYLPFAIKIYEICKIYTTF